MFWFINWAVGALTLLLSTLGEVYATAISFANDDSEYLDFS